MLFMVISMVSCSFKSVKPTLEQEELPAICDGLIYTVKKNWKQHQRLRYFEYNEVFLTTLQRDYIDCLMNLKKTDIISLFGKPTEDLVEGIYYSLKESCMGTLPHDCKILLFQFRKGDEDVIAVQVQDYTIHIHQK